MVIFQYNLYISNWIQHFWGPPLNGHFPNHLIMIHLIKRFQLFCYLYTMTEMMSSYKVAVISREKTMPVGPTLTAMAHPLARDISLMERLLDLY